MAAKISKWPPSKMFFAHKSASEVYRRPCVSNGGQNFQNGCQINCCLYTTFAEKLFEKRGSSWIFCCGINVEHQMTVYILLHYFIYSECLNHMLVISNTFFFSLCIFSGCMLYVVSSSIERRSLA